VTSPAVNTGTGLYTILMLSDPALPLFPPLDFHNWVLAPIKKVKLCPVQAETVLPLVRAAVYEGRLAVKNSENTAGRGQAAPELAWQVRVRRLS
jgi:hypothetical protein